MKLGITFTSGSVPTFTSERFYFGALKRPLTVAAKWLILGNAGNSIASHNLRYVKLKKEAAGTTHGIDMARN